MAVLLASIVRLRVLFDVRDRGILAGPERITSGFRRTDPRWRAGGHLVRSRRPPPQGGGSPRQAPCHQRRPRSNGESPRERDGLAPHRRAASAVLRASPERFEHAPPSNGRPV